MSAFHRLESSFFDPSFHRCAPLIHAFVNSGVGVAAIPLEVGDFVSVCLTTLFLLPTEKDEIVFGLAIEFENLSPLWGNSQLMHTHSAPVTSLEY